MATLSGTGPPPSNSSTPKILIKQGAEALVYRTTFLLPSNHSLLKIRPSKPYRHPTLDARLTRHRCLSEARLLHRCRSYGLPCPALYSVDEARGEIFMEWIDGPSLRDILDGLLEDDGHDAKDTLRRLMRRVGEAIGRLHNIDVVHGDLTTSNLMLRQALSTTTAQNNEVVMIDFGLGSVSTAEEDKAVDLYVLERAFISTHPKAEELFKLVLQAYKESCKDSKGVLKRLQEVRLRGRKKSMIG